jgi:hypothetical protein
MQDRDACDATLGSHDGIDRVDARASGAEQTSGAGQASGAAERNGGDALSARGN